MAERQEEVAQLGSGPTVGEQERHKSMRSRVCTILWWVWLAALALIATSRFFAALAWPIDLIANVSYFAAVPAAVTLLVALGRRRVVVAVATIVIAIIAAWPVRFVLVPRDGAASNSSSSEGRYELRVLEANVHGTQGALDGLIALIDAIQPDVVVAIEVSPGFERYLSENPIVKERLPFAIGPERGQLWRDMLLSRHPMHRLRLDGDMERYKHLFAFRRSCFVDAPGGRFLLTAMHPASPRDPGSWARGNEWTSLLAEVARHQLSDTGVPVVIGGDFNTTPSGYRHRIMLKGSGLRAVDELGDLTGTWPSHWPGPLRLTIDRVWVSSDVQFVSREVLGDIGSDHRPILVTLSLPSSAGVGSTPADDR